MANAMRDAFDAGLHRRVADEREARQHEAGEDRNRRPGVARREKRDGDEGRGQREVENQACPKDVSVRTAPIA